jgi:hypothetical protein
MSTFSDDDSDSIKQSDGEFDSHYDCDVHMLMKGGVDAQSRVDYDGDVDMETDHKNEGEEHEPQEDEL